MEQQVRAKCMSEYTDEMKAIKAINSRPSVALAWPEDGDPFRVVTNELFREMTEEMQQEALLCFAMVLVREAGRLKDPRGFPLH